MPIDSKKFTANKILDDVLKILQENHEQNRSQTFITDIKQEDSLLACINRFGHSLTADDLMLVIDKLTEDKYAKIINEHHDPHHTTISITFLGTYFIESGGYHRQKLDRDFRDRKNQELQLLQIRIQKDANRLKLALAVIGVFALWYTLIQIWEFYHKCHCH